MTEPTPIAPIAHLHGVIEISPLSRVVSQNGITLQLTIYRREATPAWSFIVVNETGTSIYWTEDFETDEEALLAFEADIAQHGIESYRDDAPTTCPLCRKLDEALNEAVAGAAPGPGHHLPSDQPSCD